MSAGTKTQRWLRSQLRKFRLLETQAQAAFEFILVFPLGVLFLLLLVDLGMLMYSYVSVANAAREGARYAAVNCPPAETCAADAIQRKTVGLSGGILTKADYVDVSWVRRPTATAERNWRRGDSVVVKITYPYKFIFFEGIQIPVAACADMRLERNENSGAGVPNGSECTA